MQKFSEFVNAYKAFKEKKCGSSELTTTEVKKIRESYEAMVAKNATKLEESKVEKLTEAQINEKFEETLEKYRDWKETNKGTRGVTAKEKENLREALMAKLNESEDKCEDCKDEECDCKDEEKDEKFDFEESIDGFKAMVTKYREWKKANHGTAKLTEKEKDALKAKFIEKCEEAKGEKLEESKVEETKIEESTTEAPKNERLTEAVAQYKEWKKAEHGTDEVTPMEEATIAKNLVIDDIKGKLEEAKKFVESGKKHLAEGDMMDAGADVNAAAGAVADASAMGADPAMGGDPNAMAADPNAGAALPQNIVDEISAIKTSIDSLATECGIESPVDLGADAGAGVPATTGAADPNMDAAMGAAPADPNAGAAPAPMPESIKSVKDRIAARKAKIEETISYSNTKLKDGGEEMIKTPSEKELVNGTGNISSNVKKAEWPIEAGSDKEPGTTKKLKNIEESQEDLAKKTLAEDGEFSWQLYTKLLKTM